MSGQFLSSRRSLHRSATKPASFPGTKTISLQEAMKNAMSARGKTERQWTAPQDVDHLLCIIDNQKRALAHRAQIIVDLQQDVKVLGQKLLEERERVLHFSRLCSQSEKELHSLRDRQTRSETEELTRWNADCATQRDRKKIRVIQREDEREQRKNRREQSEDDTKTMETAAVIRHCGETHSELVASLREENEKLKSLLIAHESQFLSREKSLSALQSQLSASEKRAELLETKLKSVEKAQTDVFASVELLRKRHEAEEGRLKAELSHALQTRKQ